MSVLWVPLLAVFGAVVLLDGFEDTPARLRRE